MKGGGVSRAMLVAASMVGFLGARRLDPKALLDDNRQIDFDPTTVRNGAIDMLPAPLREFARGFRRKGLRRRRTTMFANRCGAKQCARYLRRPLSHDYHADRMTWLERNAHVIAKREADQLRARGENGGRNAIRWGRL